MALWKKIFLILLTLVLTALCIAACSAGDAPKTELVDISEKSEGETETMTASGKRETDAKRAERIKSAGSDGAFSAATPEGASAAVIGKVEGIVGNEVTMALQRLEGEGEYTPTGETGIYLIPVGMAVGKGDYSTVTANMILSLDIEEDTIISVKILKRAG